MSVPAPLILIKASVGPGVVPRIAPRLQTGLFSTVLGPMR